MLRGSFAPLALLLAVVTLRAAPGDLDPTFGSNGVVITEFMHGNNSTRSSRAVALQGDGKMLFAGLALFSGFSSAIVRYETNGMIDASFGTNGHIATRFGSDNYKPTALALQADGKILMTGGTTGGIAVARFHPDGSPDAAFGSGGQVTFPRVDPSTDAGAAVIPADEGKVVVAGYVSYGTNMDFVALRYDADGNPDPGFGTNGVARFTFGLTEDRATDAALQADGKLVMAGLTKFGSNTHFAVARLTTNGVLDATFGGSGTVVTPLGTDGKAEAQSVVVQPDGRIVVAGYALNGTNSYDLAVVRYHTDGNLDPTFGTGGVVITSWGETNDYGYCVRLQDDGRLVVLGSGADGGTSRFAVARFETNGVADSTFGFGGKALLAVGARDAVGRSAAVQPDGRLILAGYADALGRNFALVRCLSNGLLDETFGQGGSVTTSLGASHCAPSSIACAPDGRFVVAGMWQNGSDWDVTIARYHPDGSLDTTFGEDGQMAARPSADSDCPERVHILSDGKILIAGFSYDRFVNPSVTRIFLMRCLPDGDPDPVFGTNGVVITSMPQAAVSARALAVLPDGKMLVSGDGYLLARYMYDGQLDPSFGTGGFLLPGASPIEKARDIAIQADGKILIAGKKLYQFAVVRCDPDGGLDPSFGDAGCAVANIAVPETDDFDDSALAITVQSDGKAVLAGDSKGPWIRRSYYLSLARFSADGTLDSSFGTNGTAAFASDPTGSERFPFEARSLSVQPDGKIVAGGLESYQGYSYFNKLQILRLNPDGSADATFGDNGHASVFAASSYSGLAYVDYVHVMSPSGEILAVAPRFAQMYPTVGVYRFESGLGPAPEIQVRGPTGALLTHTLSQVDLGSHAPGASNTVTLTIQNIGYTNLSGLVTALGGANAAEFAAAQPFITDLPPGSNTTFTVTFIAGETGHRTAKLHIGSSDLDENPFDVTLVGRSLTRMEQWRLGHFGSPGDTGEGADTHDCEPDGIPNLLEFATDGHPRQYGPIPATLAPDGASLVFVYTRNKDAMGELTFIVEWSDTLLPDDWHTDDVHETILSEDAQIQRVQVTLPRGPGPARFVRLRVTRP